jgi:hypothetical protein
MSSQIYLILCKLFIKIELQLSSSEHSPLQDLFTPATDVAESFTAVYLFLFRWFLNSQNDSTDGVCICRPAPLQRPLDMGNQNKSHRATSDKYGGFARVSQPVLQQSLGGIRYNFFRREEDATLQHLLLF